jgi:hypothetical protein
MADKPKRASEYKPEQVELVRAACLYVATKLGDMMDDLVIIGGLVPSLLIDQDALAADVILHVTVDFLIQPSRAGDQGGKLRDIEPDFAAIIAPGLPCAFRDRQQITLSGTTLFGEKATRDVWVAGAGAYVVLKALAFDSRGENKDAYDLYYVVRNFGGGPTDVAARLGPLLDDPEAERALMVLRRDFSEIDAVGPMRVAAFVTGGRDDELQADVVAFVGQLLAKVGAG